MAGLLIVTRKNSSTGFRCAGLDCAEAADPAELTRLLTEAQEGGKWGLVAVDEQILGGVAAAVLKRIRKRGSPIIVPINVPEKWGEAEPEESHVARLIRRAIGYQIKIKR